MSMHAIMAFYFVFDKTQLILLMHKDTKTSAVAKRPRDATNISISHSRSFEMTPLSTTCV